jgi:O-antigen/teichoic acid export membrane protein
VQWTRIFRNVFSNWASYLVTAVVGFVLAPIVVHSLGDTGYGLWTLVLSMTGYFGLLDLGIRSSVGRFVTRYMALNDEANVIRTTSTAFFILFAAGVIAWLATGVIAMFFFDRVGVDPSYVEAGRTALLITGLNMGCILPLSIFSAVLIAMDRFDVISGVTIATEFTRAALVVWCLRHGYGLVALASIAVVVTVVQYGALIIVAKRLYRPLRIELRRFDWRGCRELFSYSIYRFVWIVANQLIFYSDAVVIGLFMGAAAVTPYAIAGSVINYGRNIVSMVTDTLYPLAARMDAKDDRAGLQRLLVIGTQMSLLVTLPLCVGFLFLGRQFITLWMGPTYADSAVLLSVLAIPQFGSMSQYTSALVLAGMARHRAFAYFAMAEGLANLALSIVLVQHYGLIGVAWGTVIPSLICTTIVVPLYTLQVLKMSVRDYLVAAYLRPVLCATPLIGLGTVFIRRDHASVTIFLAEALTLCGVFGLASYFVVLTREQRSRVSSRVMSLVQRQAVVHGA